MHTGIAHILVSPCHTQPATIPIFLRSLASTLSHRFPINIHGDPHASPATHPYVHSVVSLLSLTRFSAFAPLEHIQLQGEYLKYLNATHITPLHIVQALLPLMRNSPSRARDAVKNGRGKRTIVMCIPAFDAHVGLPFFGPTSMSAAATLRAVDVLRREVRVAASTGGAEGMNDIEVVSLEVGALDTPGFTGRRMLDYDPKEYTKSWTPSEKLAYGPAWEFICLKRPVQPFRKYHKEDLVGLFVRDLVQIVSLGHVSSVSLCGLRLQIGSIFNWWRGARYNVGSSCNCRCPHLVRVYVITDTCIYPFSTALHGSVASYFPGALLDFIISIPYSVLCINKDVLRDHTAASATAVAPGLAPPPPPQPAPRVVPTPPEAPATLAKENTDSAPSSEHERDASENGSEADVESNDGAGVGESWISLRPDSTAASSETTAA